MNTPECAKHQPLYSLNETLKLVRHMLEDYDGEIPTQIVNGTNNGKTLKCQKNWFQGAVAAVEIAQQHIVFHHHNVPQEITDFLSFCTSQEFRNQKRTLAEDILRANTVLEICKNILCDLKE